MDPGLRTVAGALAQLGLPATLLSPLAAHAAAVREASPRAGLVSTGDENSILARHTADSLSFAVARAPAPDERWVDVGSGAGFPGLVLAIAYPQAGFTLVESNRKKAGFLEVQVLDLGLSNVRVLPQRAETIEEEFDVATARAVADPALMLSSLMGLLVDGGVAIVAGTGAVPGARVVRVDLPEVDSPGTLLMMTRG